MGRMSIKLFKTVVMVRVELELSGPTKYDVNEYAKNLVLTSLLYKLSEAKADILAVCSEEIKLEDAKGRLSSGEKSHVGEDKI